MHNGMLPSWRFELKQWRIKEHDMKIWYLFCMIMILDWRKFIDNCKSSYFSAIFFGKYFKRKKFNIIAKFSVYNCIFYLWNSSFRQYNAKMFSYLIIMGIHLMSARRSIQYRRYKSIVNCFNKKNQMNIFVVFKLKPVLFVFCVTPRWRIFCS